MKLRCHHQLVLVLFWLAVAWQPGCSGLKGCSGPGPDDTRTKTLKSAFASAPSGHERIVAVGDLHGALDATRLVLRHTGLIDRDDHWIGGKATLVQLGDQIDRGDHDREVIDLLEALSSEAKVSGGAVHSLLANHEIMNVSLNFSHVSPKSIAGFDDIPFNPQDQEMRVRPAATRGRVAAFRPGGPYATILAKRAVVMILGDTVFSHAGVVREFAKYGIEKINSETRRWMLGQGQRPNYLDLRHSPIWHRNYGEPDKRQVDCNEVRETLARLGAVRMVVGHTIQERVNAACGGTLYRIDVGMYAGKKLCALEIVEDRATPMTIPR